MTSTTARSDLDFSKDLELLLKADGKGWNAKLFQDQSIITNLLCCSCHNVCLDAVELGCNDHKNDDDINIYCAVCLDIKIRNNNDLCPISSNMHPNPVINNNRWIRKQIFQLKIMCPYKQCKYIDTLNNMLQQNHLQKCSKINNPSIRLITTNKELFAANQLLKKENSKLIKQNKMLTHTVEKYKVLIDSLNDKITKLDIDNKESDTSNTSNTVTAEDAIKVSIAFKTAPVCIKKDQYKNDVIYIPPKTNHENYITLSSPLLLGNDKCPFELSFNLTFPHNPNNGRSSPNRHGGLFFGHKNIKFTRYYGSKTISGGALTTNIDWNDRYDCNPPDHGFRFSGTKVIKLQLSEWQHVANPPEQWKILFKKDNKCDFFADDKKVHSFICVSNEGHIGFWAWSSGCGLRVENLMVKQINT